MVRVQQIREGVISVQQFPTVSQIQQQQNEGYPQNLEETRVVTSQDSQPQEQHHYDRPQQQHFIIQASSGMVEASGRVLADGATSTVYSTMPPPSTPGATAAQRPQVVRAGPGTVMVAAQNGTVGRNGASGSRPSSGVRGQKQLEEEKKYDMKCYYLKRTIKSLCFVSYGNAERVE